MRAALFMIRFCLWSLVALGLSTPALAQTALTNGQIHTGTIATPGEVDQWTYTSSASGTLIVSLAELVRNPDTSFAPWVQVRNGAGTLLAHDFNTLTAQVTVAGLPPGTYTVSVLSNNAAAVGDYRLTVAHTRDPFTTSGGDQGGQLANGTNAAGRIELGDLDIWTFDASQGGSIVVSLTEDSAGGSDDAQFVPWLRVYGPSGALLDHESAQLTAQVWAGQGTVLPLPATGTYTVVAGTLSASGNAGRNGSGDYILRLATIPEPFSVPAGDDGGAITNGANHVGRVDLGDIDIWTFQAQQSGGVIVSLAETPAGGVNDPGFIPWVRVFSPNGALLSHDSADLAAQVWAGNGLVLTLPASGTYTVVVGSLTLPGNGGRNGSGDYVLRVASLPGPYSVPTADQGGVMLNGVSYDARIELGDLDLWSVDACAGAALSITATEVAGQPDLGLLPWIRVYEPNGALVDHDYANGTVTVAFTPTSSGRYTIVAGTLTLSGNGGRNGVGDYTIRAIGICSPPAPPVANADSYATPFNTPIVVPAPGILANDLNAATASLATGVTSGTLSFNANGSFTYTPSAGFSGTATFTYRAVNAAGPGNVATVTITVQTPGAPTAANDSFAAVAGTPLTIAAPGVLGNDTSPGGSALSAVLNSSTTNGSLGLNANGSFTYTPNAGFSGNDAFTYRATNANGSSNAATVTIAVASAVTVVQPPVNFRARSIVGNTITLAWNVPAAGPAPTGYLLEGGVTPGQVLAAFPTGSATPTFTLNAPNGAFYLRLKSVDGGQTSAASNEIRVYVNQPVPPSAPSHLTGLTNGSQVGLSWRNTFAGGTPSGVVLDVNGTLSGSVPLGLTDTFTFPAMPAGTYTFSVRATNAFGASSASNAVTLSFPNGCTGAPQVPENFLAYAAGNVLNVTWDPAGTGAATTSYVLNVSGAVNVSVPWATRGLSVPVPSGSYTFSIAAVNACGTSAATATQTVVVP